MVKSIVAPAEDTAGKARGIPLAAGPLMMRGLFMRPLYLEKSSWLERVPLAFWLTETLQPQLFVELGSQTGTSYFAFCQAIERLEPDARCVSVSTWKSDEARAYNGEEFFAKVRAYNDAHYPLFSRIARTAPSDILETFADGSIDLLNIREDQDLQNSFETWLPKLSTRAIVIVNNSDDNPLDVTTRKFISGLSAAYPSYDLTQSFGLTLISTGSQRPEVLETYLGADSDSALRRGTHELLGRLGRAVLDSFTAKEQHIRADTFRRSANDQKKKADIFHADLVKTKEDLSRRTKESAEARSKLIEQTEQQAVERGQLTERSALLQELRVELKAEIARLNTRLENAENESRLHRSALSSATDNLERTTEALHKERHERTLDAEKAESHTLVLQADLDAEKALRLATEARLLEQTQKIEALLKAKPATPSAANNDEIKAQKLKIESLTASLQERFDEIVTLTRLYDQADSAASQLQTEADTLNAKYEKETADLRKQLAHVSASADSQRRAGAIFLGKVIMALTGHAPEKNPKPKALITLGRKLQYAGILNINWYLTHNRDVADAGIDPVTHYLLHGLIEGREPNNITPN